MVNINHHDCITPLAGCEHIEGALRHASIGNAGEGIGVGDAEYEVLVYEFKAGLNQYLEESGAPIDSLEAAIEFNNAHAEIVMPFFGQDIFELAQTK